MIVRIARDQIHHDTDGTQRRTFLSENDYECTSVRKQHAENRAEPDRPHLLLHMEGGCGLSIQIPRDPEHTVYLINEQGKTYDRMSWGK